MILIAYSRNPRMRYLLPLQRVVYPYDSPWVSPTLYIEVSYPLPPIGSCMGKQHSLKSELVSHPEYAIKIIG